MGIYTRFTTNKSRFRSKISEVVYGTIKTIYRFPELVSDRGDTSLECFTRTPQNYGQWQPVLVRYRTRETSLVFVESYNDKQCMYPDCLRGGLRLYF